MMMMCGLYQETASERYEETSPRWEKNGKILCGEEGRGVWCRPWALGDISRVVGSKKA
jgi:hypothetical protein